MIAVIQFAIALAWVAVVFSVVFRLRSAILKESRLSSLKWRATTGEQLRVRAEQILRWTMLSRHPNLAMPRIEVADAEVFARLSWTSEVAYAEMEITMSGGIACYTFDKPSGSLASTTCDEGERLPSEFVSFVTGNFKV